jgi:hypothetical protein
LNVDAELPEQAVQVCALAAGVLRYFDHVPAVLLQELGEIGALESVQCLDVVALVQGVTVRVQEKPHARQNADAQWNSGK